MPREHEHGGGHGGHGGHDAMGVHGMLLFGEDTLYLSHLPMFQHPHNFQVILEVGFDDAATEALRTDREINSDDCYTFRPEEFHITELDPSRDGPARTSIEGAIHREHFERLGHAKIAPGAVATVRRVMCFQQLDLEASHAADQELTYLCFGRVEQLHLAHHITASPDFDQVLTARLIPGTVTDPAGAPVPEDVTGEFDPAVPVRFDGRRDTPGTGWHPKRAPRDCSSRAAGQPAPTGSASSWRSTASTTSNYASSAPTDQAHPSQAAEDRLTFRIVDHLDRR